MVSKPHFAEILTAVPGWLVTTIGLLVGCAIALTVALALPGSVVFALGLAVAAVCGSLVAKLRRRGGHEFPNLADSRQD